MRLPKRPLAFAALALPLCLMACASRPVVAEQPRLAVPSSLLKSLPPPQVPDPASDDDTALAIYINALYAWGAKGWSNVSALATALGQ